MKPILHTLATHLNDPDAGMIPFMFSTASMMLNSPKSVLFIRIEQLFNLSQMYSPSCVTWGYFPIAKVGSWSNAAAIFAPFVGNEASATHSHSPRL